MSEEISSDVGYVINQLNQIKNNQNQFKVFYNGQQINGQNILTKEEATNKPIVQINNQSNQNNYLTLVMIDPDAPSSSNPITGPFIHWILANFKENDENDGQTICEYRPPGPRAGTGKHRYIFLLYQSSDKVTYDKELDDVPQRRKFPLEKFVNDNQLQLIDVTLFTVNAQD